MSDWQDISTAPFNAEEPFIVWLPKLGVAVSALPGNVKYAEDGNTPVGWDGEPWFSMTDSDGCWYGLPLGEAPSHWCRISGPGK